MPKALKGRHKAIALSRPLRVRSRVVGSVPGRCPGLTCGCPFGAADKMRNIKTYASGWYEDCFRRRVRVACLNGCSRNGGAFPTVLDLPAVRRGRRRLGGSMLGMQATEARTGTRFSDDVKTGS